MAGWVSAEREWPGQCAASNVQMERKEIYLLYIVLQAGPESSFIYVFPGQPFELQGLFVIGTGK